MIHHRPVATVLAFALATSVVAAELESEGLPSQDPNAATRAHSYLRARGVAFDESAFHLAAMEADTQLLAAFLDAGMSPNHVFTQVNEETPLIAVLRWGPCDEHPGMSPPSVLESVELLLAAGADVNLAATNGATPLIDAAGRGCGREIIRTLLNAGARLQDKDFTGATAFENGLMRPGGGLLELIAAGYRLPAARARELRKAYAGNVIALEFIRRASAPRTPAQKTAR